MSRLPSFGWSTSGSDHKKHPSSEPGPVHVRTQKTIKKSAVSRTQVLLDQLKSCCGGIQEYLELVRCFLAMKKAFDLGDEKRKRMLSPKLDELSEQVEMMNFRIGASITMLNVSISDSYKRKNTEDVARATQQFAMFKRDILDAMMSSPDIEGDSERAELSMRITPIVATIGRIFRGEKVGIIPPPRLTEVMFTEETVGEAMAKVLGGHHAVADRVEEVEKDPLKYARAHEAMMKDRRVMETVKEIDTLAKGERGRDLTELLYDCSKREVDRSFGKPKKPEPERTHDHAMSEARETYPSHEFRTAADDKGPWY